MPFQYNVRVIEENLVESQVPQYRYTCTPEHKLFQVVSQKLYSDQRTACTEACLDALKGYILNLNIPAGISSFKTGEILAVNEAFAAFYKTGIPNTSSINFYKEKQEFLKQLKTQREVCKVVKLTVNGVDLLMSFSATLVALPLLAVIAWVLEPAHSSAPS